MTDADRECRALVRYLTGREPDEYVLACYQRGRAGAIRGTRVLPIDRLLMAAVRWGRIAARSADGYARLARPTGPLRRRATLAMAILENAPAFHAWLNSADTGLRGGVLLRAGAQLAASGLLMGAGLAGFGLVHLATAGARGRTPASDAA